MINISRLYCGMESSSDRFRYQSESPIGPIIVYNCTNKCNQNCLHCYSKTGFISDNELDTAQAKGLLKNLADNKCAVVLFSGGEPLERHDLFGLLDYSRQIGLRAVISTNGSLIDESVAKKLVGLGVSYAGISIDGTEETHDKFRGNKGCFAAAINGIKFCKAAGLKVGLRFTITNHNCTQIRDIFALAAELNIPRICFYHIISAGQAAKNNLKCTIDQTRRALNDILDCTKEYASRGVTEVLTVGNHADGPFVLNRLKRGNSPLYEKSLNLLRKFGGNKIGVKLFDIDPAGNVHPDQFWQNFSLGNVTKQNIEDVFKNSINLFKDKISFAPDRCKKCQWLALCGTNMRFTGTDLQSADWILEPACYLNDEEIFISGKSNEYACQDAKA
jgi:radical SAM protein with 4Fe4S-binding SPASM domain